MERPKCRRCLLSEIDPDGVYATVREYVDSLDDSIKADEKTYKQRLLICRECERLTNGMCSICGCFVEVRAVKKNSNCPDMPNKW